MTAVLLPFRRDKEKVPYSSRAEVEAFFDDFYEFNRNKLAPVPIFEREIAGRVG